MLLGVSGAVGVSGATKPSSSGSRAEDNDMADERAEVLRAMLQVAESELSAKDSQIALISEMLATNEQVSQAHRRVPRLPVSTGQLACVHGQELRAKDDLIAELREVRAVQSLLQRAALMRLRPSDHRIMRG